MVIQATAHGSTQVRALGLLIPCGGAFLFSVIVDIMQPCRCAPPAPPRLHDTLTCWLSCCCSRCVTSDIHSCLSSRYCLAGKEQQSRPLGRKVKSGLLPEFHFHHATRVRRNEFGVGCVCHDAVGIASCASWNDGGRDLKNQ